MIITCPNCNKQFKIDNSLIPDEGRDLQCGSCNHVWFYEIEKENKQVLKLNEELVRKEIEINAEKKEEKISSEIDFKKKEKNSEKKKNNNESKDTSNKISSLFSYLIVFIISFVALIILLDTLKTPLINVFPGLNIILFNLFETLKDIKLFIIDLI